MSDVFNVDYIPTDIWLEICSNLSIKSLYSLRATCKGLRTIVDDRSVWHSALSNLVEIKDAVYSREDLESMSAPELREASVRIVKVDRAFRSLKLPHKKAPIPASIDTSECSDVALFPGGDRLLFLGQDGSLIVYRLDTGATVMSYPSLNDGWSHHVNIHGVHPTSLYSGYIVIVATAYNPEDHFADVLSRELRVYKYTRHSIEYMFLEQELHSDADPCFHLFYEQDKIRVTQLYPSSPSDARLIGVSTRTVENGRDTREDTHFCMAESLPFISIGWESLELLSPEYVLVCPQGTPCTAHLINITQASKLTTETPTVLHPFWSSEFDSPLSCLGRSVVSVTKRWTSRHPAVRALLISKKRLYSLHIPMHDESSVRLTSTLVPEPPTPARIEYQIHGDLNHGLVRMQHFSELSRRPGQRSRTLARTGLWSYTADYPLYPESHGDSPGYMRLGRETSSGRTLPEVQLGNTLRSFTSEGIEAESIEFGVDTVSGRLVHFAHLQMMDRPPGAAAIRRVEMYVIDDTRR